MKKKAVLWIVVAVVLVAMIAALVNRSKSVNPSEQSGTAEETFAGTDRREASSETGEAATRGETADSEAETVWPSSAESTQAADRTEKASENASTESEPGEMSSEVGPAESSPKEPSFGESTEIGSAESTSEGTSEEIPSGSADEPTTETGTVPTQPEESSAAQTRPTQPTDPTQPTQPSTAHTHTTAERVKKAATCKETGTKEIYCTECREVISTVTIQKLAHTTAERTKQAATCTAAGVKETYCTKCGDVISTASIPKLSHTTERHVVREATTTAEGLYQMVCTVCHTVVSEGSIPMIETEPAPTFYVHVEPPVDQHSVQCGYGSLAGAEYSLYRVNIGAGQTPSKTSPMTLIETFVSGADGTANSRSVETERDVWYCYRNSKASPGFVMYGTGGLSGKYFFFRNKSGVVNYTSDLQSYYKFDEDPTPGLLEFFWAYAAEKGFRTDIRSDSYDTPVVVTAQHPERGYEDIKTTIDDYAELYLPTGQITGVYAEVTSHREAGEDNHSNETYEITIYYSNV